MNNNNSYGYGSGIFKIAGSYFEYKSNLSQIETNMYNMTEQTKQQMKDINFVNSQIMSAQALGYIDSGVLLNAGTARNVLERTAARAREDIATSYNNYVHTLRSARNQTRNMLFANTLSNLGTLAGMFKGGNK
jgi:hypothetical protein